MTRRTDGLLGVVLAGGGSRRYGSDKADAVVGGRTMLRRAVGALTPHVERTGLVLGADRRGDPADLPRLPVRRDSVPGLGPLEGLRVALEWAREEELAGVVALACDLPLVDERVVGALVEAWRERRSAATTPGGDGLEPAARPDAVVPVAAGRPQPLAAVYADSALETVRARLEGSERSLLRLLADLRVDYVEAGRPPLTAEKFLNVNTPEDGEAAGRLLESSPGPGGGGAD